MKARDILTLIGSISLALGPTIKTNGATPTTFWLGEILSIVGGVLIGARAVQKGDK